MTLRNFALGAAAIAVSALTLAATSAYAGTSSATIHIGTAPGTDPNGAFFIISGSPTTSPITADLYGNVTAANDAFSDFFTFTIPQNGLGSGSVTVSSSGPKTALTINDVVFTETVKGKTVYDQTYTAAQAAAGSILIPITDGAFDSLEVQGQTGKSTTSGTFAGQLTFNASATPEPATWLLMIGGLGMIGFMLRRRSDTLSFA